MSVDTPSASYVVNATAKDGRTYRITVQVDLHAIAREYGPRAFRSKGKRARMVNGMVKVVAESLPETFARTSALPTMTEGTK